MFYDRMTLLLKIWNPLVNGILYLAFQAFPLVFAQHGFTEEQEGLTLPGIGVGILGAIVSMVDPKSFRLTFLLLPSHRPLLP